MIGRTIKGGRGRLRKYSCYVKASIDISAHDGMSNKTQKKKKKKRRKKSEKKVRKLE
jgi:CelD/BcsL family acetyltransferase involved in cellulose biosynthesis